MPFPFVERATLENELQYSQHDFPNINGESDWNELLDRALKSESERIENFADDGYGAEWRDDDATIPFVVRGEVIRLARQYIAGIREDGLDSEGLVSGANYDYRPPSAIREEVKTSLDEAGYRTSDGDDFVMTT